MSITTHHYLRCDNPGCDEFLAGPPNEFLGHVQLAELVDRAIRLGWVRVPQSVGEVGPGTRHLCPRHKPGGDPEWGRHGC